MIKVSPAILPALLPAYRRAASFLGDLDGRLHALRGDEQFELFKLFAARFCSVNPFAEGLEGISHSVNIIPATSVLHCDGPTLHNADQCSRVVMPATHFLGIHKKLSESQRSRAVDYL